MHIAHLGGLFCTLSTDVLLSILPLQAAVEQKQMLLRHAYKLTTDAEAKCKDLEQQLTTANARCLYVALRHVWFASCTCSMPGF